MMYFVSRTCTEVVPSTGEKLSRSLEDLRPRPAYVLLGDPGSGKTEAFKAEAETSGGLYVSARDFLALTLPDNTRGRTIFIDGLDESRAGEGDGRTPLDRIRRRLDELGRPSFRLSCREADWLGASDRQAIAAVASGGDVAVVHLNLLTREEVRDILVHHPAVSDPDAFLKNTEDRGLDALLQNPQTLNLLIEAVQGNEWPRTRQETFLLACEKLAAELNAEHRTATRGHSASTSAVLHAAGGLCVIQLFADISAFTENGQTRSGVVALRDIACLNGLAISQALKTRLFVGGEEQFTPVHRSVAEYLAACFLSEEIKKGRVTVGRVLALMTAADGGTLAGLRGLHAWLAVQHPESRARLSQIDPLGVVLYGDAKLFSVEDKIALLKGLHDLGSQHAGFRWQDWSAKPFGALATPDMVEHFRSMLRSPSRDEGYQALLDCVLDAIRYGDPLPELENDLRAVVSDTTRWPIIRSDALAAYIHVARSDMSELRRIAEDIRDGKIDDPDDEMLGRLLRELFPHTIAPKDVFSYLHKAKRDHLIGTYYMFWSHEISERAGDDDLPTLLDALVEKEPGVLNDHNDLRMRHMVGSLLRRAVIRHGESISEERLYKWLGTSVDKHGSPRIDREDSAVIKDWIEVQHPQYYTQLLSVAIATCASAENFRWCLSRSLARLFSARPPEDLGRKWLSHAETEQDQQKANQLFHEAVGHLFRGDGDAGLSLEFFEDWVKERPRFAPAYQQVIYEEIPDWRREHAEQERQYKEEEQKHRDNWMQYFRSELPRISAGTAHPKVLHDLASAYLGRFVESQGESGVERLQNFLGGDEELVSAALHAMDASVQRPDLPTISEILELDVKGQMHFIRQACLVGLEERYSADPLRVIGLGDDVLSKAVAFQLTHSGNDPEWFKAVIRSRPDVVANVLMDHVLTRLKARKEHIGSVHALAYDEEYASVARRVVGPLLRAFPARVKKKLANALDDLLKAALKYMRDEDLTNLIDEKLAIREMDATQCVYWLAAGLVMNPCKYEAPLRTCIGKSRPRIQVLSSFFSDSLDRWIIRQGMQESSPAYLIRMFAPTCVPDRPPGAHRVSPAMHTADFVHALITRLGGTPTEAAQEAIQDLLKDSSVSEWHRPLRHALHSQRASYREATFRHPTIQEVCNTLESGSPANAADLSALTLEHLRDLANEMRHGNTDQYKQFWNVDKYARPVDPRPEDACRDSLLERFKDRLRRFGVQAVPEGHYADDKRADIRVSYATSSASMAIPIEIKRDSHPDLWKAISDQLIDLYTREPESKGRGIFVVFWFGANNMPTPPDGDKPTTAAQLETKLGSLVSPEKRELIAVCVIDCSLPEDK